MAGGGAAAQGCGLRADRAPGQEAGGTDVMHEPGPGRASVSGGRQARIEVRQSALGKGKANDIRQDGGARRDTGAYELVPPVGVEPTLGTLLGGRPLPLGYGGDHIIPLG